MDGHVPPPSEAEWEYACRAGAITSRYYGETEELLGKYACYTKTSLDRSMLPVGSLKPNDLGLFDMLGNALEWCQEHIGYYALAQGGQASSDVEDSRDTRDMEYRVGRGGSFDTHAGNVRAAARMWHVPTGHINHVGFRPARTFR
jgi:formylglycine-generating enzyme required for sulfatase activity